MNRAQMLKIIIGGLLLGGANRCLLHSLSPEPTNNLIAWRKINR